MSQEEQQRMNSNEQFNNWAKVQDDPFILSEIESIREAYHQEIELEERSNGMSAYVIHRAVNRIRYQRRLEEQEEDDE